jgi:hypothetical protein
MWRIVPNLTGLTRPTVGPLPLRPSTDSLSAGQWRPEQRHITTISHRLQCEEIAASIERANTAELDLLFSGQSCFANVRLIYLTTRSSAVLSQEISGGCPKR